MNAQLRTLKQAALTAVVLVAVLVLGATAGYALRGESSTEVNGPAGAHLGPASRWSHEEQPRAGGGIDGIRWTHEEPNGSGSGIDGIRWTHEERP